MTALFPRIQSWWLLWLAAVITMAIVAASQLFTNRISLYLDRQASELLAADLLITANDPLPDSYRQLAEEYRLQTAETVELRSAIFIDEEPQLVELKAVSDAYPLRGTLEKKTGLVDEPERTASGPARGELWVDNKLASQMRQSIELGYRSLPVSWVISYEPDRGGSLFNLAPRVMLHLDDLASTGLLVPGSRARYNLLVAGETVDVQRFEGFIKPLLAEGQRLQTLQNARPEMRNALERTRKFFALSIVMTLVIAMVAIAITARYAASRESTQVAVMRTFGISSRRLLWYYLFQVGKVWIWALPAGLLLGVVAQFPLQWALGFWFDARLPEATCGPYLLSGLIGLISLIGFSLPPLLNVIDTPPMQVFRQTQRQLSRKKSLLLSAISLFTLFAVLMLIVSDLPLAGLLFALVLITAAFIPLVIKLLLTIIYKMGSQRFWLKSYVLSRLLSRNRNALFVMSGFSLTLLSVLLISLVKDQLMYDWERQLPEDKPNYFLINIPTAEVQGLTEFLNAHQVPTSGAYALVRARLAAINNVDVKQIEFPTDRAYRLINHVFNISYTDTLPEDNAIIDGEWLGHGDEVEQFSVEQGMAEDMGLKLGDHLQFTLAGSVFEGRVTSIRSVIWENFRPNFFIIGTKAELADKPQTWLLSAYIDERHKPLLKELVQKFPTLTLLDISEVMQRIKSIIERASLALEFFFLFAVFAAVIVLLSALNSANHDRELEIALLQALGANRRHKLWSQLAEFISMGLLVGVFAALFATLIGWIVGARFFDLPFTFSPALWLYSVVGAVSVISLVGVLFVYRSFSISPMRLLRS